MTFHRHAVAHFERGRRLGLLRFRCCGLLIKLVNQGLGFAGMLAAVAMIATLPVGGVAEILHQHMPTALAAAGVSDHCAENFSVAFAARFVLLGGSRGLGVKIVAL